MISRKRKIFVTEKIWKFHTVSLNPRVNPRGRSKTVKHFRLKWSSNQIKTLWIFIVKVLTWGDRICNRGGWKRPWDFGTFWVPLWGQKKIVIWWLDWNCPSMVHSVEISKYFCPLKNQNTKLTSWKTYHKEFVCLPQIFCHLAPKTSSLYGNGNFRNRKFDSLPM